jgi:ketosteroid isomerase-like protein
MNSNETEIAEKIIAMEKAALERWCKGDPSGFLEISAEDVVYFDPFMEKRLDGLDELKKLYESLRGQVNTGWFEMPNPKVHVGGNMAVLTFNFNSEVNGKKSKWNCTEVYRKEQNGQWKIIQTHWSLTKA